MFLVRMYRLTSLALFFFFFFSLFCDDKNSSNHHNKKKKKKICTSCGPAVSPLFFFSPPKSSFLHHSHKEHNKINSKIEKKLISIQLGKYCWTNLFRKKKLLFGICIISFFWGWTNLYKKCCWGVLGHCIQADHHQLSKRLKVEQTWYPRAVQNSNSVTVKKFFVTSQIQQKQKYFTIQR